MAGGASAVDVQHGIGFTKGCTSPTKIGDPYSCSYGISNLLDEAEDTLTIHSLVDVVHAASGDVNSGNIFSSVQMTVTGGATCTGGTGTGTPADPYTGVTSCTLPFGGRVNVLPFSHYTVQASDFTLPGHALQDDAQLGWHDLCDDPAGTGNQNCNPDPPNVGAASQSLILQLVSQTATDIHNAQHQVVTVVAAGSTVHDFVTVTGQPGSPIPTGNVTVDWFTNNTCTGQPAANSGNVALDGTGHADATGFAQGPLAAGLYGFKAHYLGDATYSTSDGPCEPLRVVDANIQITPNGVNRVGATHTFTAHVNINDGTGLAPASGALVSFTIDSGPGTLSNGNVSATSCSTNASGNCTIDLTSAVTGVTTVSAHTTVLVFGVSLTRHTDGTGANSGPAVKRWVNAKISIVQSATNRVGQPHVFTVTLMKDIGDGNGFVAAAGEHVDVTLTDNNGAVHTAPTGTCTAAGTNTDAAGQCTISFTSNSTGTVTAHASSSLSVAGSAPFTVETDGQAPNSGDAVKTFVNAKIAITPNATNRVGDPHTFTVTLMKDAGDGNGFVAAAGEHVDVTLTDNNGANHTAPTGTCTNAGPNTNAAGECTITFTSNSTGTVTGHASSTLSVNGSAAFTVQTDGQAPNSGDAVKTFVNAKIAITPTATNRVGDPHTFTVTLQKDVGDGNGFVAAAGEHVDVALADSNGANHTAPTGTCTNAGPNTNAAGQCTITFTSNSTGTVTGHASSTLSVAGSPLFKVETDGQAPNSGNAVKTFVDAKIAIAPDATNEVGAPHTFTATLWKDTGDGNGFVKAQGEHVDVSLTDALGANHTAPTGTCTNAGPNTNAAGECTITFTSNSTGTVTGHASSTLNVGGVSIHVETNGQAPNSGDAVKTFVDAYITISPPQAVNPINTTHTYTAHVFIDDGSGAGFVNAPNQTLVTFAFVGAHVGTFTGGNTCTITNGLGTCTVDTTSALPGNDTMQASTTVVVGGVTMTRTTGQPAPGHPNGENAHKNWQGAKISIAPNATNEIGHSHTFTVTVEKDVGNGFLPAPGEHVDVTLTDANGATHTAPTGTCTNAGPNTDANGQCTITFLSNTAGTVTGHASSTIPVNGHSIHVETDGNAPNSGDAGKTFVDANIQISPLTANNPVSTNHTLTAHVNINAGNGAGYVNAPNGTSITFSLTNSGGASAAFVGPSSCTTAGGTGSCAVVISSSTTGTTTVKATTTVTVGGVALTRATGDAKLGDSADANKTWADDTVRTDIHNAAHTVILTAVAGTIVHDNVQVARAAGTPASVPNPSGSVIFHRYATINCSGAAVNQTVALTPGSPSTAESDTFAPTADMSYQAEYLGDANYPAHTGACEPLTVTPLPQPAIAIVKNPKTQTVAVGGTATFTITVTNTGNVTLTDVHVVDPLSPNCNRTKAQIPALASMAPGAAVTYTCTRPNVRAAFDNVATAIGTPPSGPDVTATDTAPVKTKALVPKKIVKKPKIVSHKKPKATG